MHTNGICKRFPCPGKAERLKGARREPARNRGKPGRPQFVMLGMTLVKAVSVVSSSAS